jgi:hypothetical protein
MGTPSDSDHPDEQVQQRIEAQLPQPTASFRRRAWWEFQRALDPLGPPKPLPRGRT